MDDTLERLGAVEKTVSDIRSQVTAIAAVIPHLATKADVASVEAKVAAVEAKLDIIPHLATKADVSAVETSIIKWMIATVLTSTALAVAVAKLLH